MSVNPNMPLTQSASINHRIKYRTVMGMLALGLSGTVFAGGVLEFSPSLPYVGADVYQRNVTMVNGLGSESLPNRMPQGNLYIGTWLNDYIGVEGGWMFTEHKSRVAYNNIIELGVPLDPTAFPAEFKVAKNTLTINGPHLDIVGQMPIGCTLRLLGSVGMSVLKITATNYPLATEGGAVVPADAEETTKRFRSRRAVPAFGVGVMYPLSEMFTIRLLARYEMTSKFKNMQAKFPDGTTSVSKLSFKNNLLFGLGIACQF